MIPELEAWLRGIEPGGAPELEAALEELLRQSGARIHFEAGQTLEPSPVHRLHFRSDAPARELRSLVIKRLSLDRAHREQRAVRHWLPQVGLAGQGPPLLEVAAAPRGDHVWHVYEDLGDRTLAKASAENEPGRELPIRAAVALLAALHRRFVAQPLLPDCRLAGIDFGASFFASSMLDAVRVLSALRRLDKLPGAQRPLVDRLLERLSELAAEGPARSRDFAELGWPETLLHGDPWLTNFMLTALPSGPQLRLIDWDRAGVGPALYDLSGFLRQFPAADRPWILDAYRESLDGSGWCWPDLALLERVAEGCELGRFASCLLWRTLSVLPPAEADLPGWIFEDLLEMESWFALRTPLLAAGRAEASAA